MARHLPVVETRSSIRGDGSRNYVHPADVHGRFTTARHIVFWVLILIYAALPWLRVRGNPAVLLDIAHRRFYLFGLTFNAQDTWMLFFLLTGIGFTLFFITALLGRVWCGWACPQTVFLEGVFRRVERLIEGPRETRLKRNARQMDFEKFVRKAITNVFYFILSVIVAHIFLSYFVSMPGLLRMVRGSPGHHPEAFAWAAAITVLVYFNFAWFREQLCLVVCPYGRLQSVLIDQDSMVIGYDTHRGEPRGKAKAEGVGDCVDCNRCVVVCPTGIDIRNGLQLDCVGCAACIDACDEVMDKLHRPRGLVRYDSLNGLARKPKRILRGRVYFYVVLGIIGLSVATFAMSGRRTFEANVLRLPGALFSLEDGNIRNRFELHLANKQSQRVTFLLEPLERPNLTFVFAQREVSVDSMADVRVPMFITMPREHFQSEFGAQIRVRVRGPQGEETRVISAPFLGPLR